MKNLIQVQKKGCAKAYPFFTIKNEQGVGYESGN